MCNCSMRSGKEERQEVKDDRLHWVEEAGFGVSEM